MLKKESLLERQLSAMAVLIGICVLACGGGDPKDSPEYKAKAEEVSVLQAKLKETESKLSQLEAKVESYEETPQALLTRATAAHNQGNYIEAKKAFDVLALKFPESKELAGASEMIAATDKAVEEAKAKEEAEKKAKEEEEAKAKAELEAKLKKGLKGLKPSKKTSIQGGSLTVRKASTMSKWTFDRYGTGMMQRQADRGETMLVVDVEIKADGKSLNLPALVAFSVQDGRLVKLASLMPEFYKWSDYGAYLGNDHDFKNDFAKTAKIKFTYGHPISVDASKGAVLVFATQQGCYARKEVKFNNPPVKLNPISGSGCTSLDSLTLGYAITKELKPIAVLNSKKL